MDKMTKEQRSRCMASIHSKATKPEMVVRRYLFAHGFRYRVNHPRLPGHPHGHLRQRLFLARPWRLQTFCHAKEQDRLLASEDWTQQKQGQGGAETPCQHGVALYHGMGMSTEAKGKGGNPSVARLHHQPHLCRRPQVKTVCAAGRRKRHCSRTWCRC